MSAMSCFENSSKAHNQNSKSDLYNIWANKERNLIQYEFN